MMGAPRTRKKVSRHARLMQSAARKLEQHKTLFALTVSEYRAARELVYAAADFVNEYSTLHPRTQKRPRVFHWRGARYWLGYTTLWRVHVRVTGSKALFSSAVFVI